MTGKKKLSIKNVPLMIFYTRSVNRKFCQYYKIKIKISLWMNDVWIGNILKRGEEDFFFIQDLIRNGLGFFHPIFIVKHPAMKVLEHCLLKEFLDILKGNLQKD